MNIGALSVSLQADARGVKTGAKEAVGAMEGIGSAAKKLGGILAATFAAQKVIGFGADSIRVFSEADQVWNRLGGTLRTVGVELAGVRGEIDKAARAMQDVTTVGDEDFAQSLATLVRISGDYQGSMANVKVAADLAAGAQIDLGTASELVGKAMIGNTTALRRMGIEVKEGENAVDAIAKRFQSMAENEARSFAGQLTQINKEWGDFQEAIGSALVGLGGMDGVLVQVRDKLKSMAEWVAENRELVEGLGRSVVAFAEWVARDIGATVKQFLALRSTIRDIKRDLGFGEKMDLRLEADPRDLVLGPLKGMQPLVLEQITVIGKAADTTSKAIRAGVKATTEQVKTWFDEQREILKRPLTTPQDRLDREIRDDPMVGNLIVFPALLTQAMQGFGRLTVAMSGTEAAMIQARGIWSDASAVAGDNLQYLGYSAQNLLANFTPLGILTTVLSGAFSAIAPVLEALTIPMRVLGEIIGSVVIKPLQLLARALGFLIRGIGKLVDRIPGVSGGPLIRAGQEMIDASHGMAGAANQTTQALEKMKGSLTNVPPIFDYLLRRRQAAVGGGGLPGGDGGRGAVPRGPIQIAKVEIHAAPGQSASDLWDALEREAELRARRGGVGAFELAMGY
jgi:hypothetical protein